MAVSGIDNQVIGQICIIVRDVEATAQRYAEILGFDAGDFQVTELHDQTEATYHGKPTDARAKLTAFNIGRIQFELLQPLEPPSAWWDYLDQHGEGVHHVAFFVAKTEPVAQSFRDEGYQVTHQGLFTGQTGRYTYLDTDRDLGVVIELLEVFSGIPTFNVLSFPADKGIGTDVVCQVGMIVSDIAATAQRYHEVLGVPLPSIQTTLGDSTYKGQPSSATAKLAFMNFGQVTIELIQPDEQPSVWRDYLNARGEGAQHIAFQIGDTQQVVAHFGANGIEVAQQGLYSDKSGMYTYMASDDALGTTIELLESFKK